MRGLSERAPQFLRDCGEEGGSRHARLWFLPTVLLLVQASRITLRWLCHTPILGLGVENDQCSTGWLFSVLLANLCSQFVSEHVAFGPYDGSLV